MHRLPCCVPDLYPERATFFVLRSRALLVVNAETGVHFAAVVRGIMLNKHSTTPWCGRHVRLHNDDPEKLLCMAICFIVPG